jgi:hypothetical protein
VEFLWSRKLLKTRTNGRAGTRTPPAGPGEPTEGNSCPTLGSVAGRGLRASLSSTRHRRQGRRRGRFAHVRVQTSGAMRSG